jgi:hypothetical protein
MPHEGEESAALVEHPVGVVEGLGAPDERHGLDVVRWGHRISISARKAPICFPRAVVTIWQARSYTRP